MISAYAYGIDISEWQGDIDLSGYVNKFVIIRAGYWTVTDKYFLRNVKKCRDLGIPFGLYWFSEALTVEMAAAEADAFIECIKGINPDMGVWIDIENSEYKKANGWTPDGKAGPIAAYLCRRMSEAGYYTGVYCSKSWLKYVDPDCSGYDHWVASWGSNDGNVNDDTSEYGTIMQYTSKLNGSSLDGDICYVDIDHYSIKPQPDPVLNRIDHDMLIKCLAYLTIAGMFGNNTDRADTLGSIYNEVQMEVNRIYES